MIIFIDIDGTICSQEKDYNDATPFSNRIANVNRLYDDGHTIVFWTARGTQTGINWYDTTRKQLDGWGVKYHELRMGKPAYDLFIDDRNIHSDVYFKDED